VRHVRCPCLDMFGLGYCAAAGTSRASSRAWSG
jgi:hypothetical protein